MADRKTHIKIGTVTGGLVGLSLNILYQLNEIDKRNREKFDFLELGVITLSGCAAGAGASLLPDIFEPSLNNPHHRKFFHSVTFGTITIYGMYKVNTSKLPKTSKTWLMCTGAGYLSHLIADSTTDRGLPII